MTHDAEMRLADRYGPRAVIAGASEGIGEVLAHRLAGAGIDLVLIARSEARLRAVAADVEARHGRDVRVLPLDLTDPGMHRAVAESCRDLEVGLVVYAAGSVNRTLDFTDDPYEASLRQVELNCIGPLGLARALGPAMLERGRGGIVMLASLAALAGAAQIAVYSAVKAFQVNFGEGLWAEMSPRGVDVCTAVLGQTWTPALERQGMAYDPETDMLAGDAADEIIANIGNGPTYVVGARNQAIAARVWPDRRTLVQMIGAHTSAHAARASAAPSSATAPPASRLGLTTSPAPPAPPNPSPALAVKETPTARRHPEMAGQQADAEQNGRPTAPADGHQTAPACPSVPVRGFHGSRNPGARTQGGRRRSGTGPCNAYALVSGVRLG